MKEKLPERETEFVLGTFCTIQLFEEGEAALCDEVFGRLRELENILSANREGTDLDRVNREAGISPVPVRRELIDVLERALDFARMSGGAFDPAVGPLVKLWGIGTAAARVPGEEEIAACLPLIDYREVLIDREAGTVFLARPGMALDLGGIAKGYAADEAARLLREHGVSQAVIDLGGNILVIGERKERKRGLFRAGPAARPWRVVVQDPREERGGYLGVIEVRDKSVVTSGVYERFFEDGGARYHHILSTETGRPVENGLLSVTIVAEKSIDADALSTAVFALGPEEGPALLAAVPGAEAILVFQDNTVLVTPGLKESFSLSAEPYRIK